MGNLVMEQGAPYLHSTSYDFTNYASSINIGNYAESNYKTESRLTEAIDIITTLKEIAEEKERHLYEKSSKLVKHPITNATQWADEFLGREKFNEETKNHFSQRLLFHVNSKGFKEIIYNGLIDLLNENQQIAQQIAGDNAIANKIADYLKTQELGEAIGQVIAEILDKKGPLKNIEKDFLTKFNAKGKINKKSDIQIDNKKVEKLIKKEFATVAPSNIMLRRNMINYLISNLLQDGETLDDNKNKVIERCVDNMLRDTKLWTTSQNATKGGFLQESIEVFYFNLVFEKTGWTVTPMGQEKVNRFGKYSENEGVYQKTDMKFQTPDGEVFNFQEKNTDTEVATILENFYQGEKVNPQLKKFMKLKLHDTGKGMSYPTFLNDVMSVANFPVSNDFLAQLEYLLVNYNMLSQDITLNNSTMSMREKGQMVNKTTMLKTGDIINKFFENFLIMLISDFVTETTPNHYQPVSYDFIIYNSRILIPISKVYELILKHLQQKKVEYDVTLSKLKVSTSLKGDRAGDFKTMWQEKRDYIEDNGVPESRESWYVDDAYVLIGRRAGTKILNNNLVIKSTYFNTSILEYAPKNLVSLLT